MSFLRRLILAISLLLLLGVPLSAMYYEPAQSLPPGWLRIGLRSRTTPPPRARKLRELLYRRNRRRKMRLTVETAPLCGGTPERFSTSIFRDGESMSGNT